MNPVPGKTIAYIIASSHSGSTLLSALMGAQAGVRCLGEADVFSAESKTHRPLDERQCSCRSGNWRACPFWQAVEKKLQSRSDYSLATLDLSTADQQEFAAQQTAFWSALSQIAEEPVLVDSSKKVELYERLVNLGLPLAPIYLIRSPYGVVYSEIKKGKNWLREAFGYLHVHLRAQLVLRNSKYLTVHYEELVKDPEPVLRAVSDYLQLPLEQPVLNWHNKEQHLLRGNGMILRRQTGIVADEAWKVQLSRFQKAGIWWVTLPLRLRFFLLNALYLRLLAARKGWLGRG